MVVFTGLPLQPLKVSIPMTCSKTMLSSQHDVVFNVLYGSHMPLLHGMVKAMALRLNAITGTEHLSPVLRMISGAAVGPDVLRAVWILLLNVDMRVKELIVDPCNRKYQRNALQVAGVDMLAAEHYAVLSGMLKMDHGKARRFLTDLHDDLIPRWLQNEAMDVSNLVRLATGLYLDS